MAFVFPFRDLKLSDGARVGGKNAGLGELTGALAARGIRVPPGFAVDVDAYRAFVEQNGISWRIDDALRAWSAGERDLPSTGAAIRRLFELGEIPDGVRAALVRAYEELCEECEQDDVPVAVRSSATAEDLPDASFAGQQQTFLNVRGVDGVVAAYQKCLASIFTDRAIAYRDEHGLTHKKLALSVGVQRMVRADIGAAGVAFTLDTESGNPDVVLIHSSFGLGESVVQGTVSPDEFVVFKPALADPSKRPIVRKARGTKERTTIFAADGAGLTREIQTPQAKRDTFSLDDDDVLLLARWSLAIEQHMSARRGVHTPMDVEWAKDGVTGELFIVQARPETVKARQGPTLVRFHVSPRADAEIVATGSAVGEGVATARVCIVKSVHDIASFRPGNILVAEMTDPDWVPAMRKAVGIVTAHGGRTCHAAIVSRELGIPAVVGVGDALSRLDDAELITLSCAEGERGHVYRGVVPFSREEIDVGALPPTKTKVLMNLGDPSQALRQGRLPVDGIGLARMEFIINDDIRVHPMALARFDLVKDASVRAAIDALTAGAVSREDYFVDHLARGIALLAVAVWPRTALVRMSDFKTNEYAALLGGSTFEPHEENPMLGFRGACRYTDERYRPGFALECRAVKKAREELGLENLQVMIPFCRTIDEADRVLTAMREEGLERGKDGLQIWVMCEVPSNVLLVEDFAARFDGFSIGSNDLTQLILGVDRDAAHLATLFSERNDAVVRAIRDVIRRAHACGRPVGICGQAPSDLPGFAEFLVQSGIDSISLNPDSVLPTRARIAAIETHLAAQSHAGGPRAAAASPPLRAGGHAQGSSRFPDELRPSK
jgi:pyruvate,water dikinase